MSYLSYLNTDLRFLFYAAQSATDPRYSAFDLRYHAQVMANFSEKVML